MQLMRPVLSEIDLAIHCCTIENGDTCTASIGNGDSIFEVQHTADYYDYTHTCIKHLHHNVTTDTYHVRELIFPLITDIDIVFDGPPNAVPGRFVEVENLAGKSIKAGEWVEREDGYWVLRLPVNAGWLVGV